MGEKSSTEIIRSGEDQAVVEGAFDLSRRPDLVSRLGELGIETDGLLIVRRVLLRQGKSRIYLNGHMSTLAILQQLISPLVEVAGQSAPLIEMTGQHESRNLLSRSYHCDLLDRYADNFGNRASYEGKFQEYKALQEKLEELKKGLPDGEQRLDYLKFQRDEIIALDLQEGEETELETKYKTAKNREKIQNFVDIVESSLFSDDDSAMVRIHKILQKGAEISKYAPELETLVTPLTEAKNTIEDVIYNVRQAGERLNEESGSISNIETRMAKLRNLQRKYGDSFAEIQAAQQRISDEIFQIENRDNLISETEMELKKAKQDLKSIAEKLRTKRKTHSKILSESVNGELTDLNMKGVEFCVSLEPQEEFFQNGMDIVEFQTQSGKKDTPRGLSKAASGGELSRILLSLKYTVGETDVPRTYLFDEVDTGVSGNTAEKVGKKLKAISQDQQVICVTHLPQVATWADAHFYIEKNPKGSETSLKVQELKKSDRIREIARLISGEKITKSSLLHAEQLLEQTH
jgi:DNA repair protein RecN (Recombination protein N)